MGYLFVECYIKSAVNNTYYWVDDDGVWLSQCNTTTPDPGYRVVENYATENGKGQILRSTSNTAPLTCGACNTQPEGLLTMA